jgi:hypothetical protein
MQQPGTVTSLAVFQQCLRAKRGSRFAEENVDEVQELKIRSRLNGLGGLGADLW